MRLLNVCERLAWESQTSSSRKASLLYYLFVLYLDRANIARLSGLASLEEIRGKDGTMEDAYIHVSCLARLIDEAMPHAQSPYHDIR